jgi:hypothetical protein
LSEQRAKELTRKQLQNILEQLFATTSRSLAGEETERRGESGAQVWIDQDSEEVVLVFLKKEIGDELRRRQRREDLKVHEMPGEEDNVSDRAHDNQRSFSCATSSISRDQESRESSMRVSGRIDWRMEEPERTGPIGFEFRSRLQHELLGVGVSKCRVLLMESLKKRPAAESESGAGGKGSDLRVEDLQMLCVSDVHLEVCVLEVSLRQCWLAT